MALLGSKLSDPMKIELNGKELVPEELTVRQVDAIIASLLGDETHPLETMCLDEPIPVKAAALSVGVEIDALLDLKPSQVTELFKQVREANPFLAKAVEGLSSIAKNMLEEELTNSEASKVSESQSQE